MIVNNIMRNNKVLGLANLWVMWVPSVYKNLSDFHEIDNHVFVTGGYQNCPSLKC